MRIRLLFLVSLLFLSQVIPARVEAQSSKPETQIIQDFLRYLAAQNGLNNRVDKQILPWKLSEIYLNDSLWAEVNATDGNRIMARKGWNGAGPMLRMDYRITKQEFEFIKKEIRTPAKTEWAPEDFPENTMLLENLNLAPASYYAYSCPIVLPAKKLVLVRRYFHSEKAGGRWSCLEVYRIIKPGQYKLENCYLRATVKPVS